MNTTMGSLARQNFHSECEGHINRQVNLHLHSSYTYMSLSFYFDRDDVALPGLHEFFKKASDKERDHAEKLLKYQNMRGGRVLLQPIGKPVQDEWTSPLEAVSSALELEKVSNKGLLEVHGVAGKYNDAHLADFLEGEFLQEKVESIKNFADLIAKFKRGGPGLGEFVVDKEFNE